MTILSIFPGVPNFKAKSVQFTGAANQQNRVSHTPANPAALRFGEKQTDSLHFSRIIGKTPSPLRFGSQAPGSYDIARPTRKDRYSLGELATEAGDMVGTILEGEYTKPGKGLDQALRQLHQMEHPVTVADYRGKYKPVLKMVQQLGELGFLGVNTPEAYGGMEAGHLAALELARQLAYADLGLCTTALASIGLFGEPILDLGTEAQKQKYLPPVISGEKIGCFGLTEPDVGSDPAAVKTTAKAFIGQDGQRHWRLNGTKMFISNGNTADYAVVLARTFDEQGKDLGLSGFIVERGDKGFSSAHAGEKMGLETSDTAELSLDNVELPNNRLIGEEAGIGKGARIYRKTLTGGRIAVGMQGVGVAERALDLANKYVQERPQGSFNGADGKKVTVPVGSYPQVRELLAKASLHTEVAKLMAYHAARTKEAGLPYAKLAAMTKLLGTEVAAKEATDAAIQALGGYGFLKEYAVEKLARDARVLRIYEGTTQVQRMIIAGEIVREVFSDESLLQPSHNPNPSDDEQVDQLFTQALQAAMPKIGEKAERFGMDLMTLNAAQYYTAPLAQLAAEREGLKALKAHVWRLQAAKLPCAPEQAMLRLYRQEVLHKAKTLVERFQSTEAADWETIAQAQLGKSQLPVD